MKNRTPGVRLFVSLVAILLFSLPTASQSGRRPTMTKIPVPPPPEVTEAKTKPSEEPPPVTAEKNQDYRCAEDGGLERIIDPSDLGEQVVSVKDSDTRAVITGKPKPTYTKEARRNGIQGFVTLKVL